jgi:EmrB/QacA subfamily drug resistance transporter
MQPLKTKTGKYTVLAVTTMASFLIPFMTSSVNVALPAIDARFKMNVITLGWVTTIYNLTCAATLIPLGKLSDMYGKRTLFIIGVSIIVLGSFLSTVSASGAMLIATRGIQGIGGAAVFATGIAMLTTIFPPEERGKVLGLNSASTYIGLGTGPLIGGALTQAFGWKSIFWFSCLIGLVAIIATFWKLPRESVEGKKGKLDLPGTTIYMVTLGLFMFGVSELPDTRGVWMTASGAVAGILFYLWETRAHNPILDFGLFRGNRGFTFSNLATMVNYSGTWAVSFLLTLYLQYARGFTPRMAGLVLITSPLVQVVFSVIAGRLSDKIEPRVLSSLGMAISAIGIGMLAVVNENTSIVYILGCLAIMGAGFGTFTSPNTNAVMSSVDKKHYGVASATFATMRQIGMMLNMVVVWTVFTLVIGRVEITPAVHVGLIKSVRIAFLISAIMCGVGILFSLARGNIHTKEKGEHAV